MWLLYMYVGVLDGVWARVRRYSCGVAESDHDVPTEADEEIIAKGRQTRGLKTAHVDATKLY